MPAAPAISVQSLVKRYGSHDRGRRTARSTVEPGEVFGLLGPNGAGKTTTVEILEGYRTPDAGTVRVLGLDPHARRRAAAAAHRRDAAGGRAVSRACGRSSCCACSPRTTTIPNRPERLLDLVGLRDAGRTPVRRLSGGQAQRLSLACALIGRPEVVFLDEPTAGMDPHARATTWELVRDLRGRGMTVLLTTHAMDEAEHLCDRVAIIAGGRLAALGTPAELTPTRGGDEIWFAADARPRPRRARRARSASRVDDVRRRATGGVRRARPPGRPQRIADLACFLRDRDVTLAALQAGRRSLEEVFLQITAEASAASTVRTRARSPRRRRARAARCSCGGART